MRQWRALANSPRHVTGEDNFLLGIRLGLGYPTDHLLKLAVRRLEAAQNRVDTLRTGNVMRKPGHMETFAKTVEDRYTRLRGRCQYTEVSAVQAGKRWPNH